MSASRSIPTMDVRAIFLIRHSIQPVVHSRVRDR